MRTTFTYKAIGIIHSPYKTLDAIPKACGRPPTAEGDIEIYPDYVDGLKDIERFSHIIVIIAFHLSTGHPLLVTPPGQSRERGVFATRSPHRPNNIGLLTLELLYKKDNILHVRGIDVIEGTPVLDIKPYLKHFDCRPEANTGWLENTE